MNYKAPNPDNWKGRKTLQKDYIYQRIHCCELSELKDSDCKSVGLLGYGVDEGVKRNQGRIGAAEGPAAFRTSFGTLADHFDKEVSLYDLGDIQCVNSDLENAQKSLSDAVYKMITQAVKPLLIGGGHDIAYGHFKGIQKACPDQKIGIVNFDAHLDLRPFDKGAHSGSPFNQIASESDEFHYLCIGYREHSNPPSLMDRARELGVQLIARKHSTLQHLDQVFKTIDSFSSSVDLLYITIDLDGFADCYAPGVSAPSPLGFEVDFAMRCIDHLFDSKKVISVDLAELNPSYDIDSRTSKLAAGISYRIIKQWT